jgi:ribosomal protein S6 kinase alpha-5
LIRVLGKGAYGKVFLVRKVGDRDNGKLYAMKVLKKERVAHKQKTLEHTLAERHVLEQLKGLPFLVNMVYAFQSESKLHIVMEFVGGGELFTHLCKQKKFDLKTSQFILAELVVALEQIHKRDVIYRDLKLENILLDTEGHIKLTDFGLSKDNVQINPASSYCGTIEYMAPGESLNSINK